MSEIAPPLPAAVETAPKPTPTEQITADFTSATDGSTGFLFEAVTNPTTPEEIVNKLRPTVDILDSINKAQAAGTWDSESGAWEAKDAQGNIITSGNIHDIYTEVVDGLLSLTNNSEAQEVGNRLADNLEVTVTEKEGQKPTEYTYPEWVVARRPKGVRRTNELRDPTPAQSNAEQPENTTQKGKPESANKPPEFAETMETLSENIKKGRIIEYQAAVNGFAVEFNNILPSENRRTNLENPWFARTMIQGARPGLNSENPQNMSPEALLTDQFQQDEIMYKVLKNLGSNATPAQTAEMARIANEQKRIKGYLGNAEIDVSGVDALFETGILSTPELQDKFLKYNGLLRQQVNNFAEQHEAFKKGLAVSFNFGGKEVNITKKDLKDWGSTAAMITGLSMLLMYMEGDKENQQQGRGGMH